ncbi:fatty-acid amide hydrolase 2-A-like [Planococcus citri]|uniref:fatty-acid amide hydrolase 2-A-like n=1 Tax=Planococcus citri TaxID=170843 RepID=UPI0031F9680D
MIVILRFFDFFFFVLGKIVAPFYSYYANRPRKPLPALNEPEILTLSATSLAEKIRTKVLTSEQVVKAFVERCQQVNGQVNAIFEDRFEEAIKDARNADRFIQSYEKSVEELAKEKPLMGVPITFKECLMVKGSSYTSAVPSRKGIKADVDGDAVAALRNAGAIPIAVTNLPKLSGCLETYNDMIGYTSNPYDPNLTSGGSSGGEAALISAAGSVIGVGSDYDGSIRIPSHFCGIFGHKPTQGIVSQTGHLPSSPDDVWQKRNSIGPMCRYAEDLKLTLAIMTGEKNASSLNLYANVNLSELKIYYMLDRGFKITEESVDPDIKKAILKAAEHLRSTYKSSVQKIQIAEMDDTSEMWMAHDALIEDFDSITMSMEDPLLDEDDSSVIKELLKFFMNKDRFALDRLMAEWYMAVDRPLLTGTKIHLYMLEAKKLTKRLKKLLKEDGVLFYPTSGCLACYQMQLFWKGASLDYAAIVNILGFPATHVPMGLNKNGIPVGFQVIAAPNQDRLCFAVAEELQKAFGGWKPPPMIS